MSGLKRTVHERCQECGKRDSELVGEMVFWNLHRCPHSPPGPSEPPRRSRLSDVDFVRGDWTTDELREEMDELRYDLHVARHEARDAERTLASIRELVAKEPQP